MTDEEKKAIIELKHYCNLTQYWKNIEYTKPEFDDYVKTILNLIEKQQKEIEGLDYKNAREFRQATKERDEYWKDKIKAKIEELEKQDKESKLSHNYLVIPVLQLLLKGE